MRRTLALTALAAAGIVAGAVLARQRARHHHELTRQAALLIDCVERLDDYDTALEIIGQGMIRPRKRRGLLHSVKAG